MIISIANPLQDTYIFIAILVVAIIFSWRRRETDDLFPSEIGQELKGLAILAIVFSHVGYFLVSDHRFLFPLSIMAGVGLNLFLFLSGYGLVTSALKKPRPLIQFYGHRLTKLFVPFWSALVAILAIDWYWLGRSYDRQMIINAFLGWFPRADLWADINSPFWYFSLILFYYLVFPLVFIKKAPWLSALIIYLATYLVVGSEPSWLKDVLRLYEVHLLAFPVGVAVGGWFFKNKIWQTLIGRWRNSFFLIRGFSYLALLAVIAYTAYYSGVDQGARQEEFTSLITMAAIILLFLIKKSRIGLLTVFGWVSYEIYLCHWPILSRYDLLFSRLPAWLALVGYLGGFLVLSWIWRNITHGLIKK